MFCRIFRIIVIIILAISIGLCVASYLEYFSDQKMYAAVGYIGSLASLVGLLSMGGKRLSRDEIRDLDMDMIKKAIDNDKRLQELEIGKTITQKEIDDLREIKEQLANTVSKVASLTYYTEQQRIKSRKLYNLLYKNNEIREIISELEFAEKRAMELGGEIDLNPKLKWVFEKIKENETRGDDWIAVTKIGNPIQRSVAIMGYMSIKMIKEMVKVYTR